jgi:4-diphosphocytidyl-2-C-methyl-D-erythritol kinase
VQASAFFFSQGRFFRKLPAVMSLEKNSPCKVNLLLNILGRRPDGFHELETIMQPVGLHDRLRFDRAPSGVALACNEASLPTDATNLVHRAATRFLQAANVDSGVQIHLEKRIPLAAGLGGGSGNAATTLLGLNELFGHPLSPAQLDALAASLGSDVPFFLQSKPALATGRGECIEQLAEFPALHGRFFLLFHPGFGIATAWAYQNLARFPQALNGQSGRAQKLLTELQGESLAVAGKQFYNSLEAPALEKFPILAIYQEFLLGHGAEAALMSGSGSTTFALFPNRIAAETAAEKFRGKFGQAGWLEMVPV